jgi:hypothetical protein
VKEQPELHMHSWGGSGSNRRRPDYESGAALIRTPALMTNSSTLSRFYAHDGEL